MSKRHRLPPVLGFATIAIRRPPMVASPSAGRANRLPNTQRLDRNKTLAGIQASAVAKRSGLAVRPGNDRTKRHRESAMVASRRWVLRVHQEWGDLVCDRSASYRAKNAASMSLSFRHLGSARRGLSPNSQALARAYKNFRLQNLVRHDCCARVEKTAVSCTFRRLLD
jgi:hypothetical protein